MKRLLLLLILVQAGAASAAPLSLPPRFITAAEFSKMSLNRRIETVYRLETDGLQYIVGFVYDGVDGVQAAGAYTFDPASNAYVEFYASLGGIQIGTDTFPVVARITPDIQWRLRGLILTFHIRLAAAHAADVAYAKAKREASRRPVAAPKQPAPPPPVKVEQTRTAPAPPPPVVTSRLTTFWNEHRIFSILAVVLLVFTLGSWASTWGPRPIVVRQDEVIAALSASERQLAASRARLQQLSTAVDVEEAKFVERVSAIVTRR